MTGRTWRNLRLTTPSNPHDNNALLALGKAASCGLTTNACGRGATAVGEAKGQVWGLDLFRLVREPLGLSTAFRVISVGIQ